MRFWFKARANFFYTFPAASKIDDYFKSGQKRLNNNHIVTFIISKANYLIV